VVTADGVIAIIKAASTGAEHFWGAQPTGGGWPPWGAAPSRSMAPSGWRSANEVSRPRSRGGLESWTPRAPPLTADWAEADAADALDFAEWPSTTRSQPC